MSVAVDVGQRRQHGGAAGIGQERLEDVRGAPGNAGEDRLEIAADTEQVHPAVGRGSQHRPAGAEPGEGRAQVAAP